jgi:hypothetical protein
MKIPSEELDIIATTVAEIEQILKGKGSAMQGAILGDLLATWLHGHSDVDDDPVKTAEVRDELLAVHINYVKLLVAANDL